MIIKKFWGRYIFPNITRKERQAFKGGLTIDPVEPGVHKDVAVFDYASLYPTTIMAYNISPETFLFSLEQLGEEEFNKNLKFLQNNNISYIDTGESEELFGGRYIFLSHNEKLGIIP
jgi:DNA polymerase elongation subunit (family B)